MLAYTGRRLLTSSVFFLIVATIVFLALHVLPGDPARTILSSGESAAPSPRQIEALREQLGLNRPLLDQYADYIGGLARVDLGESFTTGQSVASDLRVRVLRSLQLMIPAILLSSIVGVLIGVVAARFGGKAADTLLSSASLIGFSVPVFVFGYVTIVLFAIWFPLLPAGGWAPLGEVGPGGYVAFLVLPVLALSLRPTAEIMRMTRASVLDEFGSGYVQTARSKGLSEHYIFLRHILRNSLLPVVTLIGLHSGTMFAGTVLVERVFNWPGLGTYLVAAVSQRDYPVIQGAVLVAAAVLVLINLVTDLSYAWLNPRLRDAGGYE